MLSKKICPGRASDAGVQFVNDAVNVLVTASAADPSNEPATGVEVVVVAVPVHVPETV